MSGGPWLRNMSVPSKTTISLLVQGHRNYGHGIVIALPKNFNTAGVLELLTALGGEKAQKESPDQALRRLIDARAKELPLPLAVAITDQARRGDTRCTNLTTIVTILAKSSSRVYLRDKEPNLSSIVAGRRLVLLVPSEVRL